MIAFPSGVRVWLATGHTDRRKEFGTLAVLVQETLKRDPHVGDLYVFRGRQGDLLKVIWHDGQGACLFTKRLERGRFLWPSIADGVVTISSAQLSYLLSGIDWRMPQKPGVRRARDKCGGLNQDRILCAIPAAKYALFCVVTTPFDPLPQIWPAPTR